MPKVSRKTYRIAKKGADRAINISEGCLDFNDEPIPLQPDDHRPENDSFSGSKNSLSPLSINSSDSCLEYESEIQIDEHNTFRCNPPPEDNVQLLQQFLIGWSVQHNITQLALTDLLKQLKLHYPTLPSDARTLLKTPTEIVVRNMEPGHYYHFGLEKCLQKLLSIFENHVMLDTIEVCINIDGLPISKSSSSQLYPILCNLFENRNVVNIIGLYHGNEKPSSANNFLKEFVDEAAQLTMKGLVYKNKHYNFKIKALICDAPAKSFVKYTKNHNGYFSCQKCCIEGNYMNNRMCFLDIHNLVLRSNDGFKLRTQEDHHVGTSALESIPNFNMVDDVPLDYMHLICLGVVRKLIVLWMCGKPPFKLSNNQINTVSTELVKQCSNITAEFNRKPRSLNEAKRWKATEFRQFLFYTGPIILKSVLGHDRYLNFLVLHVACTILSNPVFKEYLDYAHSLMEYFVDSFSTLYGAEHISHNVHNLLHLTQDVKKFGGLDEFSAFPFENYMQTLKKLIRKPNQPLMQIIKRKIEEDEHHNDQISNVCVYPQPFMEHFAGPLINLTSNPQYKKVQFKNFALKFTEPDNYCCLKDNSIVVIKNFATCNGQLMIIGRQFESCEDFYTSPCKSSDLNIYLISNPGPVNSWNIDEVLYKCMKLDYNDQFVIFPLLHSL
ncbi:hypothetical protein RI129_006268 [Pyrocoelia pectoralis]|uniref:Transposase domain-containing protein n=1 Tax=Pyrocoelia pectoralis TaxID=417401 RepID=A0AAN7VDU4_9COLE